MTSSDSSPGCRVAQIAAYTSRRSDLECGASPKLKSYKHSVGVTSHVFFCSTPLRLDTYNRCEFGCAYCFSRLRGIKNAQRGVRSHNPTAFEARLERVRRGELRSALDEFLARRVPLQLGGMQDPFTPMELREGVTLVTLGTLEKYDYPFLISTKSPLVADARYADRLRGMNVSVRISAAGMKEEFRARIERDTAPFDVTLRNIEKLSSAGTPVTLRIQPIIPGQEIEALRMIRSASDAGARHVSLEFLKLPIESRRGVVDEISDTVGYSLRSYFSTHGMLRVGPDYTLSTEQKLRFLAQAKALASRLNVSIGAGDTELIHLSDGAGCCNGSSLFLRDAHVFDANFTGILKGLQSGQTVSFENVLSRWSPTLPVSTYLMTDSRVRVERPGLTEWQSHMAQRWNKGRSVYSPLFFAGVTDTGLRDGEGRAVYRYERPKSLPPV